MLHTRKMIQAYRQWKMHGRILRQLSFHYKQIYSIIYKIELVVSSTAYLRLSNIDDIIWVLYFSLE
jgi:hypothetical protein